MVRQPKPVVYGGIFYSRKVCRIKLEYTYYRSVATRNPSVGTLLITYYSVVYSVQTRPLVGFLVPSNLIFGTLNAKQGPPDGCCIIKLYNPFSSPF